MTRTLCSNKIISIFSQPVTNFWFSPYEQNENHLTWVFLNLSFQLKEFLKLIQVQQIAAHDLYSENYGFQGIYLKN